MDSLTPAMAACLEFYRGFVAAHDRAPTLTELAELLGGITVQSVSRTLDRLRLAGFELPMSRAGPRPPRRIVVTARPSIAETERRLMVDLVQEADAILCRLGDAEDRQWGQWRDRAAPLLTARPTLVLHVPVGRAG